MENLDVLPIWGFFAGMIIIVLAAAEIGFRFGIRLQDRGSNPGESRMTGTVLEEGLRGAVAQDRVTQLQWITVRHECICFQSRQVWDLFLLLMTSNNLSIMYN